MAVGELVANEALIDVLGIWHTGGQRVKGGGVEDSGVGEAREEGEKCGD